jgi:hypothetical protein
MGGDTLVEVEDLVGLGAAGRPVAGQLLEATPLALVSCDKRVKIHIHTVFAVHPGRDPHP